MMKPKQIDDSESRMIALVRTWRRQAFEARQQVDPREQARQTQNLLRKLGLKVRRRPGNRRNSAA